MALLPGVLVGIFEGFPPSFARPDCLAAVAAVCFSASLALFFATMAAAGEREEWHQIPYPSATACLSLVMQAAQSLEKVVSPDMCSTQTKNKGLTILMQKA